MVQIIKKISLEVSKPNLIQAIVAKQYDNNSRFLQVTLIHEGKKIEIAPTSTVIINAKRIDGEEKPFAGEANNDGTATVPLTYWMLELEGEVWCDVSVVDTDGRKLTSTKFDLLVERASCSSDDIAEDENYDILVKLIEDVKKAKEDLSGQGLQEPPSNSINEWEDNVIYKCTTEKTVSYTFTDESVQEITIGNALMPFVLKIDTEVYTFGFSVYALCYAIDESTKTINTIEISFAETIDKNSTEWQIPSAKLVYEKIKEMTDKLDDELRVYLHNEFARGFTYSNVDTLSNAFNNQFDSTIYAENLGDNVLLCIQNPDEPDYVYDGLRVRPIKAQKEDLTEEINTALEQAKASGEFDGADGKDGANGTNGKDGTSVTVASVSESTADGGSNVVTFSDGKTLTVKNGSKGSKGDKGDTGSQGIQGEKGEQGIQGVKGDKGDKGDKGATGSKGADGYTPVKGTDYFTEADKEEIITEVKKSLENSAGSISPLKGKKIVYDGDSICSSWGTSVNGGAYPQIIANIVEGTFDNQGVGGGRLRTQEGSTDTFHSIVDNLVNLPTDADLYCFEGGVNDHWHDTVLGDFSKSDFTGEVDKTTFCGALETIFRYCLTNFVGKPICYIITHKCPTSAFSTYGYEHTFADFRDKALGICEKYAIPVYDAWKDSGLNSWNASHLANYFIVSESTGTGDGTHPNEEGYRRYYVPQLIDLFERIMPIGATDPEPPAYTNVLDTVGWTENVRISSSGELKAYNGRYATGLFPVSYGDTIYLKNVTMPDSTSDYVNKVAYYTDENTLYTVYDVATGGGGTAAEVVYEDGNCVQFKINVNCAYIRIGCSGIDETSIITVNEPIE